MKPQSLTALTAARFFAALAVLVSHFGGLSIHRMPFPEVFASAAATLAVAGVSFFFILSGFILTYNYCSRFENGVAWPDFKRFARARFARIYPIHLLVLLCLVPLILRAHSGHGPLAWLSQATLLQAYLPLSLQNQWNAPSWSISCEAFFYAVFPFAVCWLSPHGRKTLIVLIAAFACIELAINSTGSVLATDFTTVLRHPFARVWQFLIGCSLGVLFLKHRMKTPSIGVSLVVLTCCVILGVAKVPFFILLTLVTICSGCILMALVPMSSGRVLVALGEASYSLYIIHWSLWLVILYRYAHGEAPIWVSCSAALASVGLSLLSYHFFERPMRAALTAGVIRQRAKAGAPPVWPRPILRVPKDAGAPPCSGCG